MAEHARGRPGEKAASNVASSKTMLLGCPAGCGKWHECGVGEPIVGHIDYLDSAIFVMRDGAPALTSLRQVAA
jgi:hypothetical protein